MPDGSAYEEVGEINFIDPRVSESSASVNMRARFENENDELIPGQYIRLRVVVEQYSDIFAIDPRAVGQGRESAHVFVLNEDGNTVSAREVTLGPLHEGKQIVTSGLRDGDQIVVNGQVALRDGAAVNVSDNGQGEQPNQGEEG